MSDTIFIELEAEQALKIRSIVEAEVSENRIKIAEYQRKIAEHQAQLKKSLKLLDSFYKNEKTNSSNGVQSKLPLSNSHDVENLGVTSVEYNKTWSWMDKVRWALRQAGHLVTIMQMFDRMRVYEPEIGSGNDEHFREIQKNISAALKAKVNKGTEFKRVKSESGSFAYGFANWFNDDGTPKDEYK